MAMGVSSGLGRRWHIDLNEPKKAIRNHIQVLASRVSTHGCPMNTSTSYKKDLYQVPTVSFGKRLSGADVALVQKRHLHSLSPKGSTGRIYGWDELRHRFDMIVARSRDDRAIFFRHGATKYNKKNRVSGQHDTVLSELGEQQAASLRDAMPQHIDLIVCSALTRTIQTMHLSVPDSLQASTPIVLDARLNEVNLGVLQGRRRSYISHFDNGDIDYAPERGESYRDAAARVLSVIADMFDFLADSGSSPRVAVVFCHAGVLRIVSSLVRGRKIRDIFNTHPSNAECLAVRATRVNLPAYWEKVTTQRGDEERNSVSYRGQRTAL